MFPFFLFSPKRLQLGGPLLRGPFQARDHFQGRNGGEWSAAHRTIQHSMATRRMGIQGDEGWSSNVFFGKKDWGWGGARLSVLPLELPACWTTILAFNRRNLSAIQDPSTALPAQEGFPRKEASRRSLSDDTISTTRDLFFYFLVTAGLEDPMTTAWKIRGWVYDDGLEEAPGLAPRRVPACSGGLCAAREGGAAPPHYTFTGLGCITGPGDSPSRDERTESRRHVQYREDSHRRRRNANRRWTEPLAYRDNRRRAGSPESLDSGGQHVRMPHCEHSVPAGAAVLLQPWRGPTASGERSTGGTRDGRGGGAPRSRVVALTLGRSAREVRH